MAIPTEKKTKKYKEIKKSLINQLETRKRDFPYNLDLIEDYMDLYVTKTRLIKDIEERGVSIEWNNGGGQRGRKKNDSVELLLKVNKQMLSIISELGIKTDEWMLEDDEDYRL